jgi:tetratricopeptide (TPR) repeat protein
MTDTALHTFQQFLQQRPDDPELQERTALFYRYSANVHRTLNDVGDAERSLQESVRLLEALVARLPDVPAYRDRLAEALRDFAPLLKKTGRLHDAAEALRRSLRVAEELRAGDPNNSDYRRTAAVTLDDIAWTEQSLGRVAEMAESGRRSADLFRGLVGSPKEQPTDPVLLVDALNCQAIALAELGHPDDALKTHDEAVGRAKALLARQNDNYVQHFFGRAVLHQGQTFARLPGRLPAAKENFDKAIAVWENLRSRAPGNGYYAEYLALAFKARAEVHAATGEFASAAADLNRSRTILDELIRQAPGVPAYHGHLGRTFGALGRLAKARGDGKAAADWFAKACASLERAVDQAPENAIDRRSLNEFRSESQ